MGLCRGKEAAMNELLKIIKERKSVRTFDGRPVSTEDRERLEQYVQTITNPFGIPVRFVLLDAKEHGLSSPVLSGETLYAAGKVDKVPLADAAFGYALKSWCCMPGRWESARHGSAAR